MKNKVTTSDFIKRSNLIHNFEFDYSKVDYVTSKTKVEIICSKHGIFLQRADAHLSGQKCMKCKLENHSRVNYTTDIFIEKSEILHKNRYDYSESKYIKGDSELKIICKKHGIFEQKPNNHLQGKGCPKCELINKNKSNKIRLNNFLEKSNKIHNNKYNYSKVILGNQLRNKIKIICKEHGLFEQSAQAHMGGKGCTKCGRNSIKEKITHTLSDFKNKANKVHDFKYSYENTNYILDKLHINIACKIHGDFEQKPNNHLQGKGCPKCVYHVSKPEIEIAEFVKSLGYEILTSKRNIIKPKELDIYIPSLNKAIEFNGLYWHYSKKLFRPGYHAMKSNLCKEKGIKLLHIREELWLKDKEQIKEVVIKFLNKKAV